MTDDPISRIEAALEDHVLYLFTDSGNHAFSADDIRTLLNRLKAAEAENERLRAFERGVIEAIPGPRYMDTPDGGDVTPLEQVRRMAAEVEQLREALTEANAEAEHFKRLWHLFAASVDRLRRENMALRSLPDKPHIVLDKDSLDWLDAAGEPMRKEGGE